MSTTRRVEAAFVLPFAEITADMVTLVGGKTASLAMLQSSLAGEGVRVPDGFAVTVEAWHGHLREAGIDVSAVVPRRLTPALAATATHLITMGCGDECPVVPGSVRDDWPLRDPAGASDESVRAIRDDIRRRVEALVAREGWR